MASIYQRKDSPFFWIRFKNARGKWQSAKTSYRLDNLGDARQAKLLAREKSLEEERRFAQPTKAAWDSWVTPWIQDTYGQTGTTTCDRYLRSWRHLRAFFSSVQIDDPGPVHYHDAAAYRAWRAKAQIATNTIIGELKVGCVILEEAFRRGFIAANPWRRLGMRRETVEGHEPWTPQQITKVHDYLAQHGPDWMMITFLLGLYQAARLRQCEVPLTGIDLAKGVIHYPATCMKGKRHSHEQPIDARLIPLLPELIKARRAARKTTLTTLPKFPSLQWRRTLDRLGFHDISHHGLRVSWITAACLAGVPETQAMAFVGHRSPEVHRIYLRLTARKLAHVPAAVPLPDWTGVPAAGRRSPSARRGNA